MSLEMSTARVTEVIRKCPFCKKLVSVYVPSERLPLFIKGTSVQEAFPDLSPGEREIILTGICLRCQP